MDDQEAKDVTATVTRYYWYQKPERKFLAREALRRALASPCLPLQEDGMADVKLEEIWNILVGNC